MSPFVFGFVCQTLAIVPATWYYFVALPFDRRKDLTASRPPITTGEASGASLTNLPFFVAFFEPFGVLFVREPSYLDTVHVLSIGACIFFYQNACVFVVDLLESCCRLVNGNKVFSNPCTSRKNGGIFMPDYGYKSKLIQDGRMIAEVKKIQKSEYAAYMLHTSGVFIDAPYDAETAFIMRQIYSCDDDFVEAEKIENARKNRAWRLKGRIAEIITEYDSATFCTLTFTDEYLASTSPETRRRYVARFLKEQSNGLPYVANKDFGGKKGREHYHAVCAFRLNPTAWPCGALNVKKIRDSSKPLKIAKYLSKLTNHAIKETAKRNAAIFSRGGSK